MQHIIIGTAGHIDHGKTSLIKVLTGIDCDRLKEEKERGITIDLGFAHFNLPSGRKCGIIDVPGHEKLIKNMLAGAHGIDIAMLVVAADEGVMPQTQEHLDLLSLLGIKLGITVLTKCDLAERDWLELVKNDLKERLKGTFFENSPIMAVSSVTCEGISELISQIDALSLLVTPRDIKLPFRMPIDRVFTLQGFGTVVTGTTVSGSVKIGDLLDVHPSNINARVRGIRVYGEKTDVAEAGQRTAVNLTGIDLDQLQRGNVLAEPNIFSPTVLIDIRLNILKNYKKELVNRERVRFYSGSAEILGNVVLLQSNEISPGENGYAQLRLEEPALVASGDHFIIRSMSPINTIGGGIILNPHPPKHKRFGEQTISELEILDSGSVMQKLAQHIKGAKGIIVSSMDALRRMNSSESEKALEILVQNDVLLRFMSDGKEYLIHKDNLASLAERIKSIVSDYHMRYPMRQGISREELRSRTMPLTDSRLFGVLLLYLCEHAGLKAIRNTVSLLDFEVSYAGKWAQKRLEILELFAQNPYSPPVLSELCTHLNLSLQDAIELIEAMAGSDELVKISEGMYFAKDAVNGAKELVLNHFQQNDELSLASFRTLLGSSRKYALPLLEYFDSIKLTVRSGENRRFNKL